jgi:hypothetical protein
LVQISLKPSLETWAKVRKLSGDFPEQEFLAGLQEDGMKVNRKVSYPQPLDWLLAGILEASFSEWLRTGTEQALSEIL